MFYNTVELVMKPIITSFQSILQSDFIAQLGKAYARNEQITMVITARQ